MTKDNEIFDHIYDTDLVFVSDCWKLCGDAHCCNFNRYKSKFNLIGRTHFQELPLLPGEFEYLQSKGWLEQFGDYDLKEVEYDLDTYTIKAQSIVSRREGCACDHGTRPTICRLYPLLPRFEVDGRLIATDSMGIYEEMEQLAGMEKACQLTAIPFDQLQALISIANAIASSPRMLFYMIAYDLTKRHVVSQLGAQYGAGERNIFSVFEVGFLRQRLVDSSTLRPELQDLFDRFQVQYGEDFHLG